MRKLFSSLTITLAASLAGLASAAGATPPQVMLKTSMGEIVLELDADKAPGTIANFLQYVKHKHYDGLVFHRVIRGFMIQGGGYDKNYVERETRAAIQNEARNGQKNQRGTVAMARTGAPHSATSQFFINHGDNNFLNAPGQDGWGYAVFGKVIDGMDVVDKIASTPTRSGPPFGGDMPVTQVLILEAKILDEGKPAPEPAKKPEPPTAKP